jgi:type IV pilus assembly protein PilE
MEMKNKSGFTLLEVIIVIIIVGVLASLALPRFFSTVEYSKSTEALAAIATVRQSMERCYLQSNSTFVGCILTGLDVSNPGTTPGSHFTYGISGQSTAGYIITATRNSYDGGDSSSTITVTQGATGVTRAGTGTFSGIK